MLGSPANRFMSSLVLPQRNAPTRFQSALFAIKASACRWRRRFQELNRAQQRRLLQKAVAEETPILSESRSLLYPSETAAEFSLQAGKVQNLRIAAQHLNGRCISAGEVFGFWAHVPRPTRGLGFVKGRELREGCVIPSVGGGLCQLSNALYDAALLAGFETVERHAHSRRLPGSQAASGRDATVFWNYVDLRLRPSMDCQLEVLLTRSELIVRFRANTPKRGTAHVPGVIENLAEAESCETCHMTGCFRLIEPGTLRSKGHTAWLLDAFWPEYDRYLTARRQPDDWLFTPLNRDRWRIGPYHWNSAGFKHVREAPFQVLHRSVISRRLAAQGAKRQRAQLRFDEALARRYAQNLPPEATHLVVSQNLLPWLWRAGVLGGRTFDVLMTRLPLADLQTTLDRARSRHPESPTLGDFRADSELLAEETAALSEARHWITPHAAIARLAGQRALKLDWHIPTTNTDEAHGNEIVFPASTLARKGAYELRAAVRKLGLPLRLIGPVLEDAAFWDGVETFPASANWLADAGVVVLPAAVENQPRRLLQAIAAGIPVIASEACGLAGIAGITTIPDGDPAALTEAIAAVLAPA